MCHEGRKPMNSPVRFCLDKNSRQKTKSELDHGNGEISDIGTGFVKFLCIEKLSTNPSIIFWKSCFLLVFLLLFFFFFS